MIEVVIRNKTPETAKIASFEFARVDGKKMPAFETGSHIDVRMSDSLMRQYSLINHTESDDFYKIGVLNDPNSRGGSAAIHNDFNVGDTLTISEPRNLFPLNLESKKVMLFGGGIGITPIMSMAIDAAERGMDFELHYHTRSKADAAFYEQLANSDFADKIFFYFEDEPEKATTTVDSALKTFADDYHLYTCGPGGYMDYIFNTARANGWKEENLHKEVFNAEPVVALEGDQPFKLVLAKSGVEIEVAADQTTLEALESADIEVDVSCEMGICGACVTNVIDGTPDHRDEYFTDAEKEKNDQFTPCCSRSLTSTLTIDL